MRTPETASADTPIVSTGTAEILGVGGMTVNARVHPRGLYTTYYVEYGPTTSYGLQTEPVALPPRLGAYYRESADEGVGGWRNLHGCDVRHFPSGGASQGFVRFTEQNVRNDFNHEAVGVLHLLAGMNTGPVNSPSAMLGGGDPDLRGAGISVWLRGLDWQANGAEFVTHVQSQSNIELLNGPGWKRANSLYTAHYLTEFLLDGTWHHVTYKLRNDSSAWTYGGNNSIQQGKRASRYDYWPLDLTLGHVNINLLFLSAFVDPTNPPTGSVDFADFQLTYRNHSLLFPSNGGRLIDWPQDSRDDPATLTDGWRNGPGHVWQSVENPERPQQLVYSFETEVLIQAVQVHQNPQWPGKEVEILTSLDGVSYDLLYDDVLPEHAEPGPNFCYVVRTGLAARAKYLMVRLLSGYRRRHWGLGEIEVFGSGARMLPDDDFYDVNVDIQELEAGMTCHYRAVAANSQGITCGEDRQCSVAATRQPQVATGPASRIAATTAKIEGRLNPLGAPTWYFFEYGTDTDYTGGAFSNATASVVHVTPRKPQPLETITVPVPGTYAGMQTTPRAVISHLAELAPQTTYHYRLVAVSPYGVSYGSDHVFATGC